LGTEHFDVFIDNFIQWFQGTKITFEHQSIKKKRGMTHGKKHDAFDIPAGGTNA